MIDKPIPNSFTFEVIRELSGTTGIKFIYAPSGKGSKTVFLDGGILLRLESNENINLLAQGTYDEIIWYAFLAGIEHQSEVYQETMDILKLKLTDIKEDLTKKQKRRNSDD